MKLFRIIVFFLCLVFIANSFSFSQSSTIQNNWDYKQLIESLEIWNTISNKINNVSFYFCNSWLEYKNLTTFLEMSIRPWESKNICMIFANKSDEKFEIIAGFTKWNISNPSDRVFDIICETDITWKNTFSSLIQNSYENEFFLSGKQIKIENFSIKIPPTMSWTIYSCWMFKIKWNLQTGAWSSMFNIETVKKMPIQINITWDIYKYWSIEIITNNIQNILKWFIIIIWLLLFISVIQIVSKKDKKSIQKTKSKLKK